MQFPYYIVRFKQGWTISPTHTFDWFPYYIVRFKLIFLIVRSKISFCFHTTQYDLNGEILKEREEIFASFHTTQYDLNKEKQNGNVFKDDEFPYYIVRFKPLFLVTLLFLHRKFPYYIVRFKHGILDHLRGRNTSFPYYIVRFKQHSQLPLHFLHPLVSILHSTI